MSARNVKRTCTEEIMSAAAKYGYSQNDRYYCTEYNVIYLFFLLQKKNGRKLNF